MDGTVLEYLKDPLRRRYKVVNAVVTVAVVVTLFVGVYRLHVGEINLPLFLLGIVIGAAGVTGAWCFTHQLVQIDREAGRG